MRIIFKLVRIERKVYLLRIANVLLFLLPVFFPGLFSRILRDWHIGFWYLALSVLLLVQIKFVKSYKIIGNIHLDSSIIRIEFSRLTMKEIPLRECDSLKVKYNGYKGQPLSNYYLTLPIYTKEGIGSIEITKGGSEEKYYFLAQKDHTKQLKILEKYLLSRGYSEDKINVDLSV